MRTVSKITPVKKVTNPHEAFEKDEEERFVAKAKESPCALLFMLMLYEGLRTSEAKAICPADIKADYILVNKSIDDLGNFTPTKTCNVRKVPIFEQFKPWADKYRGESKTPCLSKVNNTRVSKSIGSYATVWASQKICTAYVILLLLAAKRPESQSNKLLNG